MKKLFLLLFILMPLFGYAKIGKIKYHKYVYYEGNIENKEPSGQGGIYVLNPLNKEDILFVLKGQFNENHVKGQLKCFDSDVQMSEMTGLLQYEINTEDKNNIHVNIATQDQCVFKSTRAIQVQNHRLDNIKITNFIMSYCLDKNNKTWNVRYGQDKGDAICIPAEFMLHYVPKDLVDFGYTVPMIDTNRSMVTITNERILLGSHTIYFKDGSTFNNVSPGVGMLTYGNNQGKITIKSSNWKGLRVFSGNYSICKKDWESNYEIEYDNGDRYVGTLKNPTNDFVQVSKRPTPIFDNGEYISNGVSEKWINGESFSARHVRLSKTLDADIVREIEDETLSEKEAEEKQAARKKQIIGNSFISLINDKKIVNYITNGITRHSRPIEEIGLNTGDFNYKATLTLKADGKADFHCQVRPTAKAYECQTIHYMTYGKMRHGDFVNHWCNMWKGDYNATWSVEGDKLTFDKIEFRIGEDGKFLYWDNLEEVELQLQQ